MLGVPITPEVTQNDKAEATEHKRILRDGCGLELGVTGNQLRRSGVLQ